MGEGKTKSQRPAKGRLRPLPAKVLAAELDRIAGMNIQALRALWQSQYGQKPPEALTKDLIARALCQRLQEEVFGGLSKKLDQQLIRAAIRGTVPIKRLKIGSTILREHQGQVHEVVVVPGGFLWSGQTYASLSAIARKITGTRWNGLKFFGIESPAGGPGAPEGREDRVPGAPLDREPIKSSGRRVHAGGQCSPASSRPILPADGSIPVEQARGVPS